MEKTKEPILELKNVKTKGNPKGGKRCGFDDI